MDKLYEKPSRNAAFDLDGSFNAARSVCDALATYYRIYKRQTKKCKFQRKMKKKNKKYKE